MLAQDNPLILGAEDPWDPELIDFVEKLQEPKAQAPIVPKPLKLKSKAWKMLRALVQTQSEPKQFATNPWQQQAKIKMKKVVYGSSLESNSW